MAGGLAVVTGKRDREVLLRQEAAKQLSSDRGGGFAKIRVGHACGSAGRLEAWFDRDGQGFRANLVDGGIVELEVLSSKRKVG